MYKVDIHHPNWDLDAFALNRQENKKKVADFPRSGKEVAHAEEEEEGSTEQQQLKYGIPHSTLAVWQEQLSNADT